MWDVLELSDTGIMDQWYATAMSILMPSSMRQMLS